MAQKTGNKSGVMTSPINGATTPVGAHPGNTGGKKGRSGRPPNWLKDWCDELLSKPQSKAQVQAVLADSTHTAYASMWKAVADRAHGRPKETVEHTGEIKHGVVILPSITGK